MINIKDGEGMVLAVVLQPEDYKQPSDKKFFSDPEDTLQVGALFFSGDSVVEPHIHKPKDGVVAPMEVIMMLRGRAYVDIYDESRTLVRTVELLPGEVMIQKRGGHGFHFPVRANILEVKHGPYYGKESDKEMI